MTATATTSIRAHKGWLDRFLSIFTDVRAGEGVTAILLCANLCCLLASYYLLKTAREALILSEGGAEIKSYAAGIQAAILLLVVPAYGMFASRVNRIRLIGSVTLFFVLHLLIFQQLAAHGGRIGVAFFLWVGVFNLMVVAQFWAFANDLCSIDRGRRLFPMIGVGGSLGAWLGARLASKLMAALARPSDLLVLAALGLLVCVALSVWSHRRESVGGRETDGGRPADGNRPLASEGGFQLVVGSKYLRMIAVLIVVVNIVNSIGEFLLGKLVVSHATHAIQAGTAGGLNKAQLIGMFYGDFFGWVNLITLVLQLLVVSRVIKRVGIGGALFFLPFVAMGSYALFALLPVLSAVRIGKMLENSTDYSLQNTVRHALFLPTTREMKYKAKQAIDAFCWRAGDVLQALVVFLGVHFGLAISQFAIVNQLFILLWLALVVGIRREYTRIASRPASGEARPAVETDVVVAA
jgi:AAA family ATP:ADP antiporter